MEKQTDFKSRPLPADRAATMICGRTGKILLNASLICVAFSLVSVLSILMTAFVALIGVAIMLVTLGLIFLWVPNFLDIFTDSTGMAAAVSEFLSKASFFSSPIGLACAALALALLIVDRKSGHAPRIVLSVFAFIACLIVLIIGLSAKGGA